MEFQIDLWMCEYGEKRTLTGVASFWAWLRSLTHVYTFGLMCVPVCIQKTRHGCGRERPFGRLERSLQSRTVCLGIPLRWPAVSHVSLADSTTSVCWLTLPGSQDCFCFVGFHFKNPHWHHTFFRPEPFSRLYIFGTKLRERKKANPHPPTPEKSLNKENENFHDHSELFIWSN